jgi:hypothetical protein
VIVDGIIKLKRAGAELNIEYPITLTPADNSKKLIVLQLLNAELPSNKYNIILN